MPFTAILRFVLSYRLKYNVERQYPGKWTTPVVLFIFAGITAFLALLNISLAGQDIVQESTAYPNDTVSDLPFSAFLPSLLRPSPGDFTPTTFKVGDTLQTNMSFFEYNILQAFDGNGLPIFSFPWSNNPFSSCDVAEIHFSFRQERHGSPQLSALISCWFPSNITLSVDFSFTYMQTRERFMGKHKPWPLQFFLDLFVAADTIPRTELAGPNVTLVYGYINPCCLCPRKFTPTAIGARNFTRTEEPHTRATDIKLSNLGWALKSIAHPACDDSIPARLSYQQLQAQALPLVLEAITYNTIQSFYHLLRLDLGIIAPNQIFTSPEVFNKTMVSRPVQELIDLGVDPKYAPYMLTATTPELPPIPQDIRDASLDVAVPMAVYLQPRFRPKPLPSAITSVFVATITMVATIWKVFSIIAGFFVDSTLDDIERTCKVEMMEEGDGSGVELLRATRRGTV